MIRNSVPGIFSFDLSNENMLGKFEKISGPAEISVSEYSGRLVMYMLPFFVRTSLVIFEYEMNLSMELLTGATFSLISRKQEVKFPTLFFVETSKSPGL